MGRSATFPRIHAGMRKTLAIELQRRGRGHRHAYLAAQKSIYAGRQKPKYTLLRLRLLATRDSSFSQARGRIAALQMLVVDPLGYGTRTPRSSLRHPDDKNCLARGRGIRVQGRE